MLENPLQPHVLQFIEAPAFSRYREDYLDDEAFAELQHGIAANPEEGDLIPAAGGIRANCGGRIPGGARESVADCV